MKWAKSVSSKTKQPIEKSNSEFDEFITAKLAVTVAL